MREKGDMQHPDEGTVHAWLDGALSGEEARAFEAHAAECAQCAAAVTEARGLLAASSRILAALDSVPGGVLPASEPEIGTDERVVPIGRSPIWRSPGWRAAAAIVLVGSVSWLATRSAGNRAESDAAPAAISSAALHDTALESPARSQADSPAAAGERSAPPNAPPNAPPVAQSAPRRAASVGEGRSIASGAAANTDRALVAPAPAPQVVAPQALPYAMPRLAPSPDVGVAGGVGGGSTMGAESAAAVAQGAPPAANANATARAEGRAADAELRVRGAAKAAPRMKASAPSGAPLRTDAVTTLDAEVQRIAGCYHIATAVSQSTFPEARSASELVPAQVELLPDRNPSAGGSWRILRPAPGAPAFRLAARAAWLVVAADSARLVLGEGTRSMVAGIRITGDSIHGNATVTDPMLPAGTMGTGIRGSRTPCSTP